MDAAPAVPSTAPAKPAGKKPNKELTLLPDFSDPKYYEIRSNGISPFQNMLAYLGGSAIQVRLFCLRPPFFVRVAFRCPPRLRVRSPARAPRRRWATTR
jgi:hypothetical protein